MTRRPVTFVVALLAMATAPLSRAADTITLKNGARVTGKILAQSKSQVFMRVGEGNAVYSKKAIRRIYEDITDQPPVTTILRADELPPWWIPLSDLYHEDWVNTLESIPAEPSDGDFALVPRLTFRANRTYELSIFGEPLNPAGLEIGFGLRLPWWDKKAARKRCRQFVASYLAGLRQFEALYRMADQGGEAEVAGLAIRITPRKVLRGWSVTIWNPRRLAAARRPDEATWRAANARNLATVLRSTGGDREWRKYSLKDAAKRFLPVERMEER